jgi:diketogulonate reductase-like aldo/keto reductase
MYVREGFEKNPVITDEGITQISQAYAASSAQVVLKWALESNVIVIPQSRNPNHIQNNFHLHQIFLSDKDKDYFEKQDGKFEVEEENEGKNREDT